MRLRLFVLLACAYLAGTSREPPWGDSHVVYETTQNLVDHGRIDVNLGGPPQFYSTRDGKKYGVFPLGNVIAMAPSYLLYKVVKLVPRAPVNLLFNLTCHVTPSLLVAGACVLFLVMAERAGASRRAALWLTLGMAFTTILAVYGRAPFSEALQTLALTWVVERGMTLGDRLSRRGAALAGVACGLLFNTKLIYIFVVPVVAGYVIWQQRRRPRELVVALGCAAVPLALLCGVAIGHNWLKTGTLLDSGYNIPGGVFSGDAYAALHGYFFSTGKSIFLYSPLLVLGFAALPDYLRQNRARGVFLVAVMAVVTLADAKFRYWHADYCWGPRLLVPLVPSMMLPAAPWIEGALARGRTQLRALAVGALVGAGFYVQLLGSTFYWDHYIRIAIAVKDQTEAKGWYTEDLHHCHFIPQFSPLVGHAWLLRHTLLQDQDILADAPWKRVIATKVNLTNEWGLVRPDWWGLEWFDGKTPGALGGGLVVSALLVTGMCWSVVGLRRELRRRR